MIGSHAFLDWLENTSDYLSPVVVKEVRQLTRGREFYYSFTTSLLIGLTVAFFGAADALSGNGTSGKLDLHGADGLFDASRPGRGADRRVQRAAERAARTDVRAHHA